MRYILFLSVFIFSLLSVNGQSKSPGPGKVTGTVLDAISKKPVEFATVVLLKRNDSSLVTGGITDAAGNFILEQVPEGRFIIKVNFIGYKAYQSDSVFISAAKPEARLATIHLRLAGGQLEEVVVQDKQDIYRQSFDKKIFQVSGSIVTEGQTATQVLQQIPSVTMDMEGNLNLRGNSNVTVLIDGKPSGLTGADRQAILDQIPASTIERIEVITNPSARYDADGMAGIINVITKKNTKPGMNGTASLSIGTRDKYNASVSYNYKNKKWNLSSNYTYRHANRWHKGISERTNHPGDTTFYFNSYSWAENNSDVHMGKIAVDYDINTKNSIGISTTFNRRFENNDEDLRYLNLDENRLAVFNSNRNTLEDQDGYSLDLGTSFKHLFKTEGQELTASAQYSLNDNNNDYHYFQEYYGASDSIADLSQFNKRGTWFGIFTGQMDYVKSFRKNYKFEAGLKSIIRNIDNSFYAENLQNGSWVPDANLNNSFRFHEEVYSVYSMLGTNLKKWTIQGGLRFEQTFTHSLLLNDNSSYIYDYPALFPSLFAGYKLGKSTQLTLNYSRRINRPGTRTLNPFTDYSDPQNLRTGNPKLRPEFIDSYELGYDKTVKKGFLGASVYYRYTDNGIQRFIDIDQQGISRVSFANLATVRNAGAELTARIELYKWWNFVASANLFQTSITSNLYGNGFSTNNNISWNAKLIQNFKIRKGTEAQLSGNYNAPNITAQGRMREMTSMDAAIRQDLMKGKASLNLSVSDIFNTQRFAFEASSPSFDQYGYRKRESRIVYLTFTYKFGKTDFQTKRQREKKDEGGGYNEGGMD